MRGVHVDPDARTARVGGGTIWGEVDHATHAFGMAVPSGIISSTGVAGLTLGGGLGHLTRKYGLTIDSLLEADVVLADGSFVKATADQNADLFWALRGGGGNFGIVTSFVFRTHHVSTVFAGPTLWAVEDAREVMRCYRDFLPQATEGINGFFAFLQVPPAQMFPEHLHNRLACGVVWCYTGPTDEATKALAPMRSFGKPIFDHVGPMPFPTLQSIFDPLYPPGLQWYWKADFLNELPDGVIDRHVEHGSKLPTMHSSMHLYPVDGAAHRVGKNETAFSFRDATWSQVIVGVDPDASNKGRITQWARDYFDAVHPFAAGGAYVNFMMEEGPERVLETYRENYERLAEIKARYDPDNVFDVNQNIKPRARATDSGSRKQ
jgi:FAD/FMN-containing dehydrogenase